MEDEAARILPKGYVIDYTGESRQLRTEGNKFLPAFNLAVILIFLVLAAQFNSFRDPFVIPSIYMLIARDHGKDREREAAIAEKGD